MTDTSISTGIKRDSNVGAVTNVILGTQLTNELQNNNDDLTVANTDTVQGGTTDEKVSTMKNNHLEEVRDTSFTNFHGMDKHGINFAVQNVHGEISQNKEVNISDREEETESDPSDNENSVTYIARHVEKIDLLNFDDSDVSISDEEGFSI